MAKKKRSRLFALLIGIFMVTTLFSGCKKNEVKGEQHLTYNLGAESESIDPALNTAVDGGTVIINAFEGLTRLDSKYLPGPGIAKSWEISDDGLGYTFHLRDNAKWSDGKPVTAKDFEYAWFRALTPETKSEYCYQLFYIKNSQAFYSGKATKDQVGIKVIDDYTIEVTLEAPTPYFLELCAFPTLMPVRQDIVEANPEGWTQDPATYIGDGPYMLKDWIHNDRMEFVKNPNYWNKDNVKLDKLTMTEVVEPAPALSAWEKGDIDYMLAPPIAERPRLQQEGKMQVLPSIGTNFTCFNVTKAPFDNAKVRQAFSLAIDRRVISELLKSGNKPAGGFVPLGMYDADGKTEFRTIGGDYYNVNGDASQAKELLAEAGYPEGKGFPEVTYKYNTNDTNKKVAEALQDMWRKNLGIEVKLENMEWKVFQNVRQTGDYQLARHAWIGDYMDPMTFLDMWVSDSANNDAQYKNPIYDDFIAKAKVEPDVAKRMQYLHDAEKILMDERVIDPLVFTTNPICVKPYVKDYIKSPLGFDDFTHAYIDLEAKNSSATK